MPKKTEQKLTAKQEAYAIEYMLNGKVIIDAYRHAYDVDKERKDNAIYVDAYRVHTNPKVSLKIHQLEMAEYKGAILSITERKELLTKWAKEGSDKAVDLLNKMEAVYVDKQEINHSGQLQVYTPAKRDDN